MHIFRCMCTKTPTHRWHPLMLDTPKRPTLKSMAAELGIHVSTLSRVLNGDASAVAKAASPDVVERIRQLAAERNYKPNIQATALRLQRSQEIGILMPRMTDLVMATLYEGIDAAADGAGYMTFVSNTLDEPARQRALIDRNLRRQVAGLIIGDSHLGSGEALLANLRDRNVPYVLISRRQPGHPTVACDDFLGGRLAAEHLHAIGCRNVAVLAGERFASTGADRTSGFISFFSEKGIEVSADRILHGRFDTQEGRRQGQHLLSLDRSIDGVFAVNDFLAIGLMGAIREADLRLGTDVAVVGFNDTPLAAQLPIPLSSVRLPLHEMGNMAFQALLARIEGSEVESVLVTPELNVRESSAMFNRS